MKFRRRPCAETGDLGDLLRGCLAEAVDAAEVGEEGGAAHRAEAGEIVEDALADFL